MHTEHEHITETVQAEDAVVVMPALLTEIEDVPVKGRMTALSHGAQPKSHFFRDLCIYFVLFLVVIAVALWFLYAALTKYEASTPDAALANYFALLEQGNYEELYASSGFTETLLNTKEEYIQYLKTVYAEGTTGLQLREKVSTDSTVKQFSVYRGNSKISTLLVSQKKGDASGAWTVSTQVVYQPAYEIIASPDSRLTVNGIELSLLNLPTESVSSTLFTGTSNSTYLPPVNQYRLENLLNPPRIEALSLNGDPCRVEPQGDNAQRIHVYYSATPEQQAAHETLAKDVATTYAAFIATDASRTELMSYIYRDSDFAVTITNFRNDWFSSHDNYRFDHLNITQYHRYSDTDFTCDVSFTPVYTNYGQEIVSEPVHYRLVFLQVEGEWKLLSLTSVYPADGSTTATTGSTSATGTTATAA